MKIINFLNQTSLTVFKSDIELRLQLLVTYSKGMQPNKSIQK